MQIGKDNDWRAVAVCYHTTVALKADGSLWQWNFKDEYMNGLARHAPTRLGIHQDWVAIKNIYGGVIACAADGSLWFWPDRKFYSEETFIALPKQPKLLGNVFGRAE